MDSAKQLKFEKFISKGKWHYIFFHGVLGWGVMTAILFSIFQYYFNGENFLETIKFALVLFPIAGVVWGASMWWYIKKDYWMK